MTTSNCIENGKIVDNLGIVSSHLVAGTGFLSDFVASLSDFFGGRSGTYKRQLESLYYDAMLELSDNARKLGANALIGVRIDIDNISGKGMSMFMITALGTAVLADFNQPSKEKTSQQFDGIPLDMLNNEVEEQRVLVELSSDDYTISQESWKFILNNPSPKYSDYLTSRFAKIASTYSLAETYETFKSNYANYISSIDRDIAIKCLYPILENSSPVLYGNTLKILEDNQLFDAASIQRIIENKTSGCSVYRLLAISKPSYSSADLDEMKNVLALIESQPDLGRVEEAKDGIFKGKGKYICRNGHKNNEDCEYCIMCGENIKGQTADDVKAIALFKERCKALEKLLTSVDS